MEFSRKLNKKEKEQYIEVCETIWGCVPIDVDWAMGTAIYKNEETNYLKKTLTVRKNN